jgi:hypothetical protein
MDRWAQVLKHKNKDFVMFARSELFLLPLSTLGGELRVLVRREADKQVLPHVLLKPNLMQKGSQDALLRDVLAAYPSPDIDTWITSSRCKDRIVDCFDRDLLFEGAQGVAIVRAVAIPEELSSECKGTWISPRVLFSQDSMLSEDCKLFLRECLNLIPTWVRYTSLAFELLPAVFSIQDLRLLVSLLAGSEIDPGNFHRRLKRLDILHPLVSGQRVHKWEFSWQRTEALTSEGLIP